MNNSDYRKLNSKLRLILKEQGLDWNLRIRVIILFNLINKGSASVWTFKRLYKFALTSDMGISFVKEEHPKPKGRSVDLIYCDDIYANEKSDYSMYNDFGSYYSPGG